MQESNDQLLCPSFNSYSSDKLAEIAAKVSDQYNRESRLYQDEAALDEYNDDFEFSSVTADSSVHDVIIDGKILPIFPIFNRDLLINDDEQITNRDNVSQTLRLPLKKLFLDETEATSCSSSSEADELESIAPGTYCVWTPNLVQKSPSRCKKSNSTGSISKRWNLRHLLRRSNSEGKESPLVFLTPKNEGEKSGNGEKVEISKERRNDGVKVAGKVKAKGIGEKLSAHEVFYVRNRAMKEGDKRKSYLPYRQDLVGFFATVGTLGPVGKTFPPF
ncbi:hypothetical protein LguiA_019584 [Lonicera macranthoides]